MDDDVAIAAAAKTGRRCHALGGDSRLAATGAAGSIDLVLLHWPRRQVIHAGC